MNPGRPLRKAVFPVAGLGTRFLPATKAIPKELLPVVDKPLIQYAVEEALAAGVDTLIFVTNRNKHAIFDHFDKAFELESALESKGKLDILEQVRGIIPDSASTVFVTQEEALGLGHAVLCAEAAVGEEPFAVLLPDDVVLDPGRGALRQLESLHRETGASVIGVQPIPPEASRKYGVAGVETDAAGHQRIRTIVEKPAPEDAPSNLGVVGRYVLSPEIFRLLRDTPRGVGGEIQLTDAIAALLDESPVLACAFEGRRYDCGSPGGFLEATIDYALAREDLRDDLLAHMAARLDNQGR
jgi:UTP--glucose-1-phosphate uridylyltransferase